MYRIETTWLIHPDKSPRLGWDDWHIGFSDANDRIFPKHPHNPNYMEGWLESFGMEAGYANQLPICEDPNYMEGYSNAQYERSCHNPATPDIRGNLN